MRTFLVSVVAVVSFFTVLTGSAAAKQCATPTGAPVTKAEYESRLVAALRPTKRIEALAKRITSSSSRNQEAAVFERARRIFRKACLTAGRIAPPTEIASVHRRVVLALGGLAANASEARTAIHRRNLPRFRRALGGFAHYGRQLEHQGSLLTAKGY